MDYVDIGISMVRCIRKRRMFAASLDKAGKDAPMFMGYEIEKRGAYELLHGRSDHGREEGVAVQDHIVPVQGDGSGRHRLDNAAVRKVRTLQGIHLGLVLAFHHQRIDMPVSDGPDSLLRLFEPRSQSPDLFLELLPAGFDSGGDLSIHPWFPCLPIAWEMKLREQ